MKKTNPDGSRTIYVGGLYEVDKNSSGTVTKTTVYYPAGGAMRVNGTLYYVLKDHLGSASVVTDNSGNVVGDQRYYPFGFTRLATGSMYTDKLFTAQREMAGLGIYHFGARFYSPYINRFLSADSLVPGYANPQNLNRFAYVVNNPLRYTDPTGHICVQNNGGMDDEFGIPGNCNGGEKANYKNPFPGGVPAAKKPGKPKKDDGGKDGKSVDPSTPLVTIVPDRPGCQELYCDSPQLISTNIEVIDEFDVYWQDVGETVTLTVLGLGVAETAPAVVVIINNPYVKIVLAPVTAAISLAMNSPGTREGDVIVTETYVVGESTSTCYGYTYFTNTIVKTTIYDSEGNLVYSETERITGYCYQR